MRATLHTVSSGSSGNGYLLDVNGEQLIIECGVPFKECAKVLKYKLEGVKAVLTTHGHR